MLIEGQEAIKDQNYEKAIRVFSEATKTNSRDSAAFLGLAEAYYDNNNFLEAKDSSERAIEINPSLSKAYTILAQSKYHIGDGIEICYKIAEKAYNLAPESTREILCFGAFSILSGKIEEGISLSNKILSIDPNNYLAYINLLAAYSKLKKVDKIYSVRKEIFRLAPSFETRFLLFVSFMNLTLPMIIGVIIALMGFFVGIILRQKYLLILPAFYPILGILIGVFSIKNNVPLKSGITRIIGSILFLSILVFIFFRLK